MTFEEKIDTLLANYTNANICVRIFGHVYKGKVTECTKDYIILTVTDGGGRLAQYIDMAAVLGVTVDV